MRQLILIRSDVTSKRNEEKYGIKKRATESSASESSAGASATASSEIDFTVDSDDEEANLQAAMKIKKINKQNGIWLGISNEISSDFLLNYE